MDDTNNNWSSSFDNAWGCGADFVVPAEANYTSPSFEESHSYGGSSPFGD